MLVLQPKQVCPYMSNCPHARNRLSTTDKFACNGLNPDRNNVFTCEFVSDNGGFVEAYGYHRHLQDKKGKMKILLE